MKRLRHFAALCVLTAPLSAALLFAAVACSSTTTQPTGTGETPDAADETPVIEQQDAAPPECKIVSTAITGVTVCDDCLQKRCCVTINTCFTDKGCVALNNCIEDCNSKFGPTDAGGQCIRTCAAGKDPEATKLLDLKTCENDRCGTDCRQ